MKKILLLVFIITVFCWAKKGEAQEEIIEQDNKPIAVDVKPIRFEKKEPVAIRFIEGKLLADCQEYDIVKTVKDTTYNLKYDTITTEKSNDSVSIVWYAPNAYYVINISGRKINYNGTYDVIYAKNFKIGVIKNNGIKKSNAKINDNGTYSVTLQPNDSLDPAYATVPLAIGASFGFERRSGADSLTYAQICTTGLANHWPFNADTVSAVTRDSVGTNNGTLTNGAIITKTNRVLGNGSLLLAVGNQRVDLGQIPLFNNAVRFAVSFWWRHTTKYTLGTTQYMFTLVKDGGNSFVVNRQSADGALVSNITKTASGSNTCTIPLSSIINDTAWNHLVINVNMAATSANKTRMFLNGQLASTATGGSATSMPDFTGFNTLVGNTSASFKGNIDQLKIWRDTLMTANIVSEWLADSAHGTNAFRQPRDTTTTGIIYVDTLRDVRGDKQVDSVRVWIKNNSDSLTFPISASKTYNITPLYKLVTSDSSLVGDTLFIRSTGFADTFNVAGVNNVGVGAKSRYMADFVKKVYIAPAVVSGAVKRGIYRLKAFAKNVYARDSYK